MNRGAPFVFQGAHGFVSFKSFAWKNHRRPRRAAGQCAKHHSKTMIKRHRNAQSVVVRELHRFGTGNRIVDDIFM